MEKREKHWRVDLHTHTAYSGDGRMSIPEYLRSAHHAGLDRTAVTDHNTMRGAWEAAAREPEFVIPGEEIKTTEGEILGYFMTHEVTPGLTPEETIARLRDQGAVISIPHPFDRLRDAWDVAVLLRILPLIDAIEGFNARCMFAEDNEKAAAFAAAQNLPVTAGSDAHSAGELGAAGMQTTPFHDAESFRAALIGARPFGRMSPAWVHLLSRYAAIKKRLSGKM